ncbi:MAG: GNAT family N-acetyltransferase [Patescibacteria group bacterium]
METERTIFSKPNSTDYDELFGLYSNEAVRKYLGGTITKAEFDEKFNDFFCAQLPECYWIIKQKGTNSFIGLISICKYHDQTHFEISYELHPDFWCEGYGTEVVKRGIEYAFNELGLEELYAETQKKNQKSIKLLEKIGMKIIKQIERFGEQQLIYSIKK